MNMVTRCGALDFGGPLTRSGRVECVVDKVFLDSEAIAEGNKFRGGVGFEKAG
jgi:hypothetical protein